MGKNISDQIQDTDPQLGGSYTRNSDGGLTRNAFTLHPGDEGFQPSEQEAARGNSQSTLVQE